MYSKKFGIEEEKLMKRFWSNSFFDAKNKKWVKENKGSLQRVFCQFVLDLIYQVFHSCMQNDKEKLYKILPLIGITLSNEEKNEQDKKLMKLVMKK